MKAKKKNRFFKKFIRPAILIVCEPPRIALDLCLFTLYFPRLIKLPKGKKQPVLVIPGFMAGDWSTIPLRLVLKKLDYRPYGWKQGTNLGFDKKRCLSLFQYFEHISRDNDAKVILVGWSLGGPISRALSAVYPDKISKIVTLGSPFHIPLGTPTLKIYKLIAGDPKKRFPKIIEKLKDPPLVPTSIIYTTTDCLLPKKYCIIAEDEHLELINSFMVSHGGFGFNPFIIKKMSKIFQTSSPKAIPLERVEKYSIAISDLF